MKINLGNIRSRDTIQFQEIIKKAQSAKTYLQLPKRKLPFNFWFLIPLIIVFFLIRNIVDWTLYYWYLGIGVVVLSLLSYQVQRLIRWYRIGKDSVLFNPNYFISISGSIIEVQPLSSFKDADITMGVERKYIARFHFKDSSIIIPCSSPDNKEILEFQNSLKKYCLSIENIEPQGILSQSINTSYVNKILGLHIPILTAIFSFLFLWFVIPIIIDNNQYSSAKRKNTATSIREYLAETRNLRHRESARNDIKNIYNQSIQKYSNKTSLLPGSPAFIKVLEYLRDNDLYTVQMKFSPKNDLKNINISNEYHILPITPSFSLEKNLERQSQVIVAVKTSLEKMFPADIITIGTEDNSKVPFMEIYYTYRNKIESLYYPVDEEQLTYNQRTWYYGIEIYWIFKLHFPRADNPIYEFDILSEPAPQFDTESFTPDAVYSEMALSAFNDFKDEFYHRFINWEKP